MSRCVLVVCTANVCRSPVAAALLAAGLGDVTDRDGQDWVVTSAGTADADAALDPFTVAAAAAAGVDISGHRRRRVDRQILATDGADLVVTMAREHLRAVVGVDPAAWHRTFTLKELARRTVAAGPPADGEVLERWMARVADGRRAAAMMVADPCDDVADPYGRSRSAHEAMVAEVGRSVDAVVRWGPWRS